MSEQPTSHRAIVSVSFALLCEMLGFPENAIIHKVVPNPHPFIYAENTFDIVIEHPDLPEVFPGQMMPLVRPTMEDDPETHRPKLVDWNWK